MEEEINIVNGELIDTYGGDFTYRYVYAVVVDNDVTFYEYHLGENVGNTEHEVVDDEEDIMEYTQILKRMPSFKERNFNVNRH